MKKSAMKTVIIAFIANALLFSLKFIVGITSGSISITADAINNLSDFLTTSVMLIGIRISSKPADKEHPYGHERFELISGLFVSLFLMYAGIDVFKSAIEQLQHPQLEPVSSYMWLVTSISIILKGIMMYLYKESARKTDSDLLEAGYLDSRNDVFISGALLVGFWVQAQYHIVIDGYLGLLIALLIIYGAFGILRNNINKLMGKRPSQMDVDRVEIILKEQQDIVGYHDLLIHTYGNQHKFASVHVELDGSQTLFEAHEIADQIEKKIAESIGLDIVIHLDPVDLSNKEINAIRQEVSKIIKRFPEIASYHDFQFLDGTISFDVVLVDNCKKTDDEVKEALKEAVSVLGHPLDIGIDRNYLLKKRK